MKTKHKAAIILMMLPVLFAVIVMAQPPDYDLEQERSMWSNEHWRKIVIGAESQMVEQLAHDVDCGFPPRAEDIQTLIDAGYTMTNTEGFAHYWYAINNRNSPLDDPEFRRALAYCMDKDVMYPEIYGPMVPPCYGWAPPGQAFWCEPDVTVEFPRYNLQMAIDTLVAAGYDPVDSGDNVIADPVPGIIDHWHMPGTTTDVRDIEQGVPEESTTSVELSEWIEGDLHEIGLSIYHTPLPFGYIVYQQWLNPPYTGWDCTIGIGLTFGVDPVFHLMYHVESIPFANIWGLDDAQVNNNITLHRSTLDLMESQEYAFAAQRRLLELMPMIPMASTMRYTCATGPYDGQPGVLGYVNMAGYGGLISANQWTRMYSRREDADAVPLEIARWITGEDADKLNPLTSDTTYEWNIMGSVYNAFYIRHPYTHVLMPWCVTDYPVIQLWNGTWREVSEGNWVYDESPIGSPGLVAGEYMRWTLRDDMTWHDGVGVNASDVEFCLDLLVKQNNERYDSVHMLIHDVNVVSEFVFDIYYTGRYAWADNDISGVSLLTPKHVWKPYIAGPDGDLWTADDEDHRFWAGHGWTDAYGYSAPAIETCSGTIQLTHLLGNGYNIFPQGGWVPDVSMRLIRWDGWIYNRILRGDNNFDGTCNVLDLWAPEVAFGSEPGMAEWEYMDAGLKADMANPAALIDGDDFAKVYDDWWGDWYPAWKKPQPPTP